MSDSYFLIVITYSNTIWIGIVAMGKFELVIIEYLCNCFDNAELQNLNTKEA